MSILINLLNVKFTQTRLDGIADDSHAAATGEDGLSTFTTTTARQSESPAPGKASYAQAVLTSAAAPAPPSLPSLDDVSWESGNPHSLVTTATMPPPSLLFPTTQAWSSALCLTSLL